MKFSLDRVTEAIILVEEDPFILPNEKGIEAIVENDMTRNKRFRLSQIKTFETKRMSLRAQLALKSLFEICILNILNLN